MFLTHLISELRNAYKFKKVHKMCHQRRYYTAINTLFIT